MPGPALSRVSTRDRIKAAAHDLYVRCGHDGFSFADISGPLGITRANIHYHFGNKRQLIAELIADCLADCTGRITRQWTAPGHTLLQRLHTQREEFRRAHARFNPAPSERNVWSPLARLRLDIPVLGQLSIDALRHVTTLYDTCLSQAVGQAITTGELRPETPAGDLARLLRVTFMSCGPVTQDSGGFAEIEALFAALVHTLVAAWRGPNLDPLDGQALVGAAPG